MRLGFGLGVTLVPFVSLAAADPVPIALGLDGTQQLIALGVAAKSWGGMGSVSTWDTDQTVTDVAGLRSAWATIRATAGTLSKKHRIVCNWDGVNSDGTTAVNLQGLASRPDAWLDNGGGVYIVAAAGKRPAIGNPVTLISTRGVHLNGIGFAAQYSGTGSAETQYCLSANFTGTYNAPNVVIVEQAGLGASFWLPDIPQSQLIGDFATVGMSTGVSDYIEFRDCTFSDGQNLIKCAARVTKITGSDLYGSIQDFSNYFGHTSGQAYYAHVWLERLTFRKPADGIANRASHMDAAQTGTSADNHQGYRLLMIDCLEHASHTYAGNPGDGGGTQGSYNDDFLNADNLFCLRRNIIAVSSPAAFAYHAPKARYRSYIDRCTFVRCGTVPSGFPGDSNAAQDFSVGIMTPLANSGSLPADPVPWLEVTNSALGPMPTEGGRITYSGCVSVDPRISRAGTAEAPEAVFKGRDFTRGGAAVNGLTNKFGYILPNEGGTQAQFVADLWANFEPAAAYAGKFAPDPRGLAWNAPSRYASGSPTPAPTAYLDTGSFAATATRTDPVDNGLYDVLVRNGSATEWKRVAVVAGSSALSGPAGGQITRAQYFGPLQVTPKTSGVYGPALVYGGLYNSKGHSEYGTADKGGKAGLKHVATWASNSPDVSPGHQGWCNAGAFYILADGSTIYQRKRNVGQSDNWSFISSITHTSASMGGVGHLGAPGYRASNNRVYFAVSDWTGSAATTKKLTIACFDASTLGLIGFWPAADVVGRAVDGIAIDPSTNIAYVVDYGDSGKLYRYDLNILDTIASGQSAEPAALAPLTDARISADYQVAQGICFKNGILYQNGSQQKGVTAGSMILLRDPATGRYLGEISFVANTSGGLEGLDFEGSQLGILVSGSTDNVNFFNLPGDPVAGKGGLQFTGSHGLIALGAKVTGDYTVFTQHTLTSFANLGGKPTLWDNRGGGTNHRGTVESTGKLTFRGNATAFVSSNTMALNTEVVAGQAYRSSDGLTDGQLSVAGAALVQTSGTGTPVALPDKSFGEGGYNQAGRTQGTLRWEYLFNAALSNAQMEALRLDHTLLWDGTDGLTAEQKAAVAAT